MQRRNRYYARSRISEYKFRLLIRYFALDLSASDTAELTRLTHKTVNTISLKIRRRIAEDCERQSPFSGGEVEADESYFERAACAPSAAAAPRVRPSSSAS